MSERLTVVFDDDTLYRRLKVLAAENHIPLKRVVEDAVRAYLGPELPEAKAFDWAIYDRWQADVELLNEEAEAEAEALNEGRILTLPRRFLVDGEREMHATMMAEEHAPYVVDP